MPCQSRLPLQTSKVGSPNQNQKPPDAHFFCTGDSSTNPKDPLGIHEWVSLLGEFWACSSACSPLMNPPLQDLLASSKLAIGLGCTSPFRRTRELDQIPGLQKKRSLGAEPAAPKQSFGLHIHLRMPGSGGLCDTKQLGFHPYIGCDLPQRNSCSLKRGHCCPLTSWVAPPPPRLFGRKTQPASLPNIKPFLRHGPKVLGNWIPRET